MSANIKLSVTIFPPEGDGTAGGVNLDGEAPEDLRAFVTEVQGVAISCHDLIFAGHHSPISSTDKILVIAQLARYAMIKASAMEFRANGDLETAGKLESALDRLMNELPPYTRW